MELDRYIVRVDGRRGTHERCWSEALSASLLSDEDRGVVHPLPQQREDANWCGKLLHDEGVWQLRGELHLQLQRDCSRCLQPFWWRLQLLVEREFSSDDDEPLLSAGGEIDLIDLLREEVWLSWQQFVLCSEECPGLCEQPAADVARCVDSPFAALSQLKF
ncbi:MAG: DUF177 domain-containing protein [Mariprofundales bacterium]|nr:DUF177 domain-containing protein [Mariprofundales bacterium]